MFQFLNFIYFTERLETPSIEDSSQSMHGSSLSIYTVSTCNSLDYEESYTQYTKKENEKSRFGFSFMKNATKCAAKKFNQMIGKAKSKLRKPSLRHMIDHSILSTSTELTDIDEDEFEEIDLNRNESEEIDFNLHSKYTSRSTINADKFDRNTYEKKNRVFKHSMSSTPSNNSLSSLMNPSTESFGETSLNCSSLIHQILAESIADLNLICAQQKNEASLMKPTEAKRIIYKETLNKPKISKRLTLYEDSFQLPPDFDVIDWKEENLRNDTPELVTSDLKDPNGKKLVDPIYKTGPYFNLINRKNSIIKRIAKTYHGLCTNIFSNHMIFFMF